MPAGPHHHDTSSGAVARSAAVSRVHSLQGLDGECGAEPPHKCYGPAQSTGMGPGLCPRHRNTVPCIGMQGGEVEVGRARGAWVGSLGGACPPASNRCGRPETAPMDTCRTPSRIYARRAARRCAHLAHRMSSRPSAGPAKLLPAHCQPPEIRPSRVHALETVACTHVKHAQDPAFDEDSEYASADVWLCDLGR
jgi:hypothetical protein